MIPVLDNLFSNAGSRVGQEEFLALAQGEGVRVERILSNGQCSPKGFWYDQETDEWVCLLRGSAELEFEEGGVVTLNAGDYLTIGSHVRHRVEEVSADAVWLAVHFRTGSEG